MYANAINILSRGHFPISLLPPIKLKEILDEVKKAIQITNPDYAIVLRRLHLYYDMKLVTFGINEERNCIVQFPIFIQLYMQQLSVLYQIKTVSVPILYLNKKAQSYIHLQTNKPYKPLNSETYISLRNQELRTYKNIGYEFYCEELFVLKHKSKYSCKLQKIIGNQSCFTARKGGRNSN